MSAQTEVVLDAVESKIRPIEFLTENGFGIFRRWEIEGKSNPENGECEFLVLDPGENQSVTRVQIAPELMAQIELHTHGRIRVSNSFWIYCAERHLAAYLSERDQSPRDGTLRVEALTPDDLNLSICWERT
jgi:hypothetical protein